MCTPCWAITNSKFCAIAPTESLVVKALPSAIFNWDIHRYIPQSILTFWSPLTGMKRKILWPWTHCTMRASKRTDEVCTGRRIWYPMKQSKDRSYDWFQQEMTKIATLTIYDPWWVSDCGCIKSDISTPSGQVQFWVLGWSNVL